MRTEAGPRLWPAPPKRLVVRVADRVGRTARERPIDPAGALRAARERTGLHDIGDPSVLEPLDVLCSSLEREAQLTPTGRWVARETVVAALANRIERTHLLAHSPEILEERIERPIFIVGAPRTGTTLLQRLLARGPDHRAPLWWEGAKPCPPPALADPGDRRVRDAERALRVTRYLAPELRAIHDASATEPEECVQLLGNELSSLLFPILYRVPSYWDWLEQASLHRAYEGHRQQLQILQWQAPPRRWVGKAPAHLLALRPLLASYPDAIVVQTHRDPVEVVASTCSLLATAHAATSNGVDPVEIGALTLRRLRTALERFARDRTDPSLRSRHPAATFVDVDYRALVEHPHRQIEELYSAAGLTLTSVAKAAMRAYTDEHPQHEHGRHHYCLEAFGLDATTVTEALDPDGWGTAPRLLRAAGRSAGGS